MQTVTHKSDFFAGIIFGSFARLQILRNAFSPAFNMNLHYRQGCLLMGDMRCGSFFVSFIAMLLCFDIEGVFGLLPCFLD